MLNLLETWFVHLTASDQPWPVVLVPICLFLEVQFTKTTCNVMVDPLQSSGHHRVMREPCEGSRLSIENGCKAFAEESAHGLCLSPRRSVLYQEGRHHKICLKNDLLVIVAGQTEIQGFSYQLIHFIIDR